MTSPSFSASPTEQFKFQSPKADDTSFDISKYFQAKARVSLNPLAAPWFELQAQEGYRVFTNKSSKRSKGYKQAEKAEFAGQLSKLWAVVVADADLKKITQETSDLPIQLAVFARNASGTNPDFQERMVNVAKLRRPLLEARDEIQKLENSKTKKTPKNFGDPPVPLVARPKMAAPLTGPGTQVARPLFCPKEKRRRC
jgi:hypothetical protein